MLRRRSSCACTPSIIHLAYPSSSRPSPPAHDSAGWHAPAPLDHRGA
ncbi:hypothetical protein YT1_3886 [Rhodococcus ruber]|nr:hypothetical protein YT1_3886 [Rhodococcus ruber]